MTEWQGTVVANASVKLEGKFVNVVLIKTNDGDRIWRTEDELQFADPELERQWEKDRRL